MKKLSDVTPEEWSEVNEFNREITEEFLQQQHLSPQTLRQYESALKIFFRFIKDKCKNLPLYELKPKHALQYQNMLISLDLSSSAVKFKRSAVSSLCGYMEVYYSDEYPMFRNIYNKKIPNPPKSFRHEKKPLTPEEFERLVKTLEDRGEWQMVAYILFSYSSGCRRSEAAQLKKEIVDYQRAKDKDGNELNYYITHPIRCKGRGKEGKIRKLQFDERAMNAIKKWLEVRGEDDNPYVFVTKTKSTNKVEQASVSKFNHWCTDIFSEIVGRRVHPHQLRSTRATHLVTQEGKDIEKVKNLLGHQSSETTKIYVVKENEDDVDDLF